MVHHAIGAIGAVGVGSGENNNYDENKAKKTPLSIDIGSTLNGTSQVAYVSNPLGAIGNILNGSQGTQSTASGIQA